MARLLALLFAGFSLLALIGLALTFLRTGEDVWFVLALGMVAAACGMLSFLMWTTEDVRHRGR
jgi:hypothetical protein